VIYGLVTCNGCFDGLHPGHLFFLGFCRAQGSRLIVGINSDGYIAQNKRSHPFPSWERKKALMDLGIIESVDVFTEDDPIEFIRRTEPEIHCIGEEYRDSAAELEICRMKGISVVYVPRVGKWSSTMMRAGK
jgi:cytidyltransferase-like protein